jgi:hypothetical protein
MVFVSTMKKEWIEASGDLLMELKTKKNQLDLSYALEVIELKNQPMTMTMSKFPQVTQLHTQKTNLVDWLQTFPQNLPESEPVPSLAYLRWLLQCHKSNQLPLCLQQRYWAELVDLRYPRQTLDPPDHQEEDLQEEEDIGQVEDLLSFQEEDPQAEDPQAEDPQAEDLLEEGEIPQEWEEGEIENS